jgi:hypothetical protein
MRYLLALVLALAVGCTDVVMPVSPTGGGPAPAARDTVEYRVSGTPATVLVRFSSADDGLAQVTTTLPWSVAFTTIRAAAFLSVEATPIATSFAAYPFLSVQIFVNGVLFREASTTDYRTVAATGTWRR